jgi:hypothetical protein
MAPAAIPSAARRVILVLVMRFLLRVVAATRTCRRVDHPSRGYRHGVAMQPEFAE